MPEERRLVTVLFSDVVGSTALGEELDPEDLRALLSVYYAIAQDVVAEHGGTLEKFIGDAVMAVFGLPAAHGDDAARALSAALALRDRVRADPALGERLPIRVGVNTGDVVATRERDGDFLITGDPVNTAARLQQAADPWAVLAGERTVRAAHGQFAYGAPRALDAKGKRETVRAYPVVARASAEVVQRMPLFGRDDDLAQLELVARRVASERRPFLVSLIAAAGTGKTRLLEELLDRTPVSIPDAQAVVAQCLPYGQRLTYWPLVAVLHRLAGLPEDAPPARVREGVAAWVRGLDPGAEEIAPLLAATVGAGETDEIDRTAVFAAWRRAFELAARSRPLVLVFEDLHWSSDSLLDLVEFVMQPRADAPLLMLALTRPELLDRRPTWGGGRRNHLALTLEPLADEAVAQIVAHLLEHSDPAIVTKVVERSEGNPFYAGELVRSIMERAGPRPDPAAIQRALAALPDTVQATVLARLDLLPPNERRVVQIGAVLGRSFRVPAVRALAPEVGDTVDGACDALVERDLVRPSGADALTFRHILIREVAYGTLPRAERAGLHAAAARWLEERAAGREEAYAELIAYHWREAATLAFAARWEPTHADEVRRSAVDWLVRAAEAARAAGAQSEAVRHLRGALELATTDRRCELHERIGDVRLDAGSSAAAYATALGLADEAGADADQRLRLIGGLAMVLTRFQGNVARRPPVGELEALLARGEELLAIARDDAAKAQFLVARGFLSFWLANAPVPPADLRLEDSRDSARRGLALAERLGNASLQSAALDALGSQAQEAGDHEEARRINRTRLGLGDRVGMLERLDAHSMVTWNAVLLGDLDDALDVSRTALAAVQPGQASSWVLHLVAWRLYALTLRGGWDDALTLSDRALLLWDESGRHAAGYIMRGLFAARDVTVARDDEPRRERLVAAMTEIAEAFARARNDRGVTEPLIALDRDGLLSALERQVSSQIGRESVERAFATCADRDWEVPLATVDRLAADAPQPLRAQAARARGLFGHDAAALGAALADFERMGARPYVARVRCEIARLTGDGDLLTNGLDELRWLGDQQQLARFERM